MHLMPISHSLTTTMWCVCVCVCVYVCVRGACVHVCVCGSCVCVCGVCVLITCTEKTHNKKKLILRRVCGACVNRSQCILQSLTQVV